VTHQVVQFPYQDVAVKIAVSAGIGVIVGLEREWSRKEIGVRTFGIVGLLGMLTSLTSMSLSIAAFSAALVLLVFLNVHSLLKDGSLELTTSASLVVVFVLGTLVGVGHMFTAAASAIAVMLLLAWKIELERFADALRPAEIRSAVLLGVLGVVVYPLLPDEYVDRWDLFNPREAWTIVVVIAGIGFANYTLLRLFRKRGLYYGAVLGGLVNSTGTNAELSSRFREADPALFPLAVSLLLLTNLAMFVRNLFTLLIFAPSALLWALGPVAAMAISSIVVISRNRHSDPGSAAEQLDMASPLSLFRVLRFALVFVALAAAGTLAQRTFGAWGFLLVSFVGGLVSSASTTATAAVLATGSKIAPEMAGVATILASVASAFVDLPLVYQLTRQKALTKRFATASIVTIGTGIVVLALVLLLHDRL
jgi:uncharacterized membrane protein (DUF4010 family)